MRKLMSRVMIIVLLVMGLAIGSTAIADQCQINGGAYIAHSEANIIKAWNHVWSGKWSQLKVMANQGELRKVSRSYYIDIIEANDNYLKFSISCAPGKEIWTLTMFTQGCK